MTPFIAKYVSFALPPRCVILNHRNFINRVLPWKYRWAHCYVRMVFSFWFCRSNRFSNMHGRKLRTRKKKKFSSNVQYTLLRYAWKEIRNIQKTKFPFSAQCSLLPHAWKEIRNVQKRRFPFNAQCIHLFVLSIVLTRSCIFNFGTNIISSILSS